ncbi:RimJ/RimL family protein N-acetyltransferase [Sphingomonas naasensis]|uniref:N-acetyltransferase n=1 Tax=Sphingomonas naasensis TaxID=1344951 RepID=A0A4S1W4U3_9SPHN|nr:GNAT family protein [Sphingomonas naasensis]NIJ19631.1 RimJ/RimL family protein N-acetyltransferase [Sphingomonas naasensis]TGX37293.1 N-acetyltransferase [Sphingomonas naasensis]
MRWPRSRPTAPAGRPTPVLTTARLRLRPEAFEDAEALHRAYSDATSMRWWTHAPFETLDQTRADLALPRPGWRRWIVTCLPSDVAIGFVAVGEKRQGNVSEVGYLFVPDARGSGYAGEAVAAVIGQIFAEGQRKIVADVDPDNAASRRLLERLGFRLEGMLRGEWETHIGVRDTALYGLLREDRHDGA